RWGIMHYRGRMAERFPKALMSVIWEMIEMSVTFAWAPVYLAEFILGVYGPA
ncbi:hypothetical protein KI387_004029, partial [Taxus chinensis]